MTRRTGRIVLTILITISLKSWLGAMRILMQFNSTRTHVMIVSRKKCVDQYPALAMDSLSLKLSLLSTSLVSLSMTIFVGIHTLNSLAKSASRRLGVLFHAKRFFTPTQRLILYEAQVRPLLEYCSNI